MGPITCTVFLILCDGPGYSGEYRSVRKRELISVDFPSPDSPARQRQGQSELSEMHFTLYLFSNRPPFQARARRNMTQSPDVYQALLMHALAAEHSSQVSHSENFFFQDRKWLRLTPFLLNRPRPGRRQTYRHTHTQGGSSILPNSFPVCTSGI